MPGGSTRRSTLTGADRFEVKDKLGSGSMGAVYRAYDRSRRIEVALKSLLNVDPRSLYRFKREFRTLADVVHPNLVSLFELHTAGDEWFFTMELVEGVPFISHVRPFVAPVLPSEVEAMLEATVTNTLDTKATGVWRRPPSGRERIRRGTLDVARLSLSLSQLTDGVLALHRAGKLHRDIKPSNVLIDRSGRVIVLDFGLAADKVRGEEDRTHELAAIGTPMYMSPEQAADLPLTEATDWYSVGVMLYESLVGYRPYEGSSEDVYLVKQMRDARAPSELDPSVPKAFEELCLRLLDRDPKTRATGEDIFAMLHASPSQATLKLGLPGRKAPFVGRQRELTRLRRALEDSREQPQGLLVRGLSGMGKSHLLRRFLAEVETSTDAVILEGRCYERESVPYKALDAVIDALTRHLLAMADDDVERCMPRDISALSKLFPVLRRVPAVAQPARRRFEQSDLQEVRRQAFGALRYLLRQLSEDRPVVLYIDDLQWGGVDSAPFLLDLLVHPQAPRLLLLLSYRLEDEKTSVLVSSLRDGLEREDVENCSSLTVSAFDAEEAKALTRELGAETTQSGIEHLISESGGSPFFITELARSEASAGRDLEQPRTLDDYLLGRVEALSDDQRRLLRVCAVAARPMLPDVLSEAAGVGDGADDALTGLRYDKLLRSTILGDDEVRLSVYHDRVREAIVGQIGEDERRKTHRALARTLEDRGRASADTLLEHWLGAGEAEEVAHWAVVAAGNAEETLAFHRAANCYQLALREQEVSDSSRELWVKYAHALTHSGSLDQAARVFARAAEGADDDQRLELGRLELEQLLRRGNLERGLERARDVLGAVGLRLPASRRGALTSLVTQRLLLKLRGMDFKQRDEADIPEHDLRRLEVCWSAASAISFVNPLLGRALQMKFMRLALSVGAASHIAKAFGLELGYQGTLGVKHFSRVEQLYTRGRRIAEEVGNPRFIGTLEASKGFAAFMCGRFPLAKQSLRASRATLRGARDARWESDISQIMEIATLCYLGEVSELAKLVPIYLREAVERGDIYLERGLKGWRGNVLWLLLDQPDTALAYAEAEPEREYHLHHYYGLLARSQHEIYTGDDAAAWRRLVAQKRRLKKSMLLRIQSVRVDANALYARGALASLAHGDENGKLRIAEQSAKALDGEGAPWAYALGSLIQGTVHYLRKDEERAIVSLRLAIDTFDDTKMALHAAVTRWGLGEILGGDEGSRLIGKAKSWMRAESIGRPERVLRLFAPGLFEG